LSSILLNQESPLRAKIQEQYMELVQSHHAKAVKTDNHEMIGHTIVSLASAVIHVISRPYGLAEPVWNTKIETTQDTAQSLESADGRSPLHEPQHLAEEHTHGSRESQLPMMPQPDYQEHDVMELS